MEKTTVRWVPPDVLSGLCSACRHIDYLGRLAGCYHAMPGFPSAVKCQRWQAILDE